VNEGERSRDGMSSLSVSAVYTLSRWVGARVEVSGARSTHEVRLGTLTTLSPYHQTTRQILPGEQNPWPANTVRSVILLSGEQYETDRSLVRALAGVRIRDAEAGGRIAPFGHAMAGLARQTAELRGMVQRDRAIYGTDRFSDTGPALSVGGGVDLRLTPRVGLRLLNVSYEPVRLGEQPIVAWKQGISNLGIPNNLTFTNLETATVHSGNEVVIRSGWQHNYRIGAGITIR
jgi:hypothetical protein